MATLGNEALTLSDYRKRMNPDGSIAEIIEALENVNPIIDDCMWIEGNLKTGNRTTIRDSKPKPSIRLLNRGVKNSKSTTRQVDDTCIILEDRSEIDIEAVSLAAPNGEGYRRSEDAAFVQGFADTVAENMFYGNTTVNPFTFNGLSARYNVIGGDKNTAGYQVLSFGTAGENTNTSVFIVGWGLKNTVGIYPKGTQAGLRQRDLGEQDAFDPDGNKFRALTTLFTWKCGLSVQDIRANAVLRNINVASLPTTSADKLKLMEKITETKNRIRNLENKRIKYAMYVSDAMYNFMENYQLDKNNVFISVRELMNTPPQMYFRGIPVKKCDAISETEAKIEEA